MNARAAAARAGRVLRDAWLMVGLTIVLLVIVESCYRGQAWARRAVAGAPAREAEVEPPNPFDTATWSAQYTRDHLREEEVRWTPYVYIRNPTFAGTLMQVDSQGHRVTPHPASTASRPVRVFFLGGSTTFGWYQRDSATIPAEAARRLQAAVGSSARIEVTNFGVPGHTFTQEVLELFLQLRAGARPDVVVFYDGINDVMATVQNNRAGYPQNEANRVADFERGRSIAAVSGPGLANDARVFLRSAATAMGRLEFVGRLTRRRQASPTPAPTDSLARDMVRVFAANARTVESLAATYGFTPVYVWQPALLATGKPLTARERWLRDPGRIGDLHRAVPPVIDSAMHAVAGARFIDATALFDGDSLEVFADLYGHTYERANPRVVDTLMTLLRPAVLRAASAGGARRP